jgi:antitoxin MazE
MQVSLIDIGTSKGIRIPSSVLKEMDKPKSFELRIEEGSIVLDAVEEPRQGWEQKFKDNDNALLIDDTLDTDAWDEI